jgi:aerobic-type carbon monoxide dehydrogenase small subunit (CoxS/CutS family)
VQAPADTPLLYVLRNDLELSGPQFGCGVSQCGSCSVLVDGKEVRSCVTPVSAAVGKETTTLAAGAIVRRQLLLWIGDNLFLPINGNYSLTL